PVEVNVGRDEITDERNFLSVIGASFDGEVVDFGSDFVTVSGGEQDGKRHFFNHLQDVFAGPQVVGQHNARHVVFSLEAKFRGGGQQDVLTIAGNDHQGPRLKEIHRIVNAHRADDDNVHQIVELPWAVQQFGP